VYQPLWSKGAVGRTLVDTPAGRVEDLDMAIETAVGHVLLDRGEDVERVLAASPWPLYENPPL